MSGFSKRVGDFLRAEWGGVILDVWDGLGLAGQKPRVTPKAILQFIHTIPLTLTALALTAGFQAVQQQSWGAGFVSDIGVVRSTLPFWQALLRTPLSLFVPALDLPVWGALLQLAVVFGIAEVTVGRLRTLAVAYAATLAGTSYARYALAVGPHGFLSLPTDVVTGRDTGPSAAVAAVAMYVALRYRAWLTASAVAVFVVGEAVLFPNLAGYEHCAGLAAALVMCWAERRAEARHRSGAPPSRS